MEVFIFSQNHASSLEGERGCMSHGVAHARSETEQQPRSAARSSMRSPHTLCDSQSAVAGNVHAWYGVLLYPVRTVRVVHGSRSLCSQQLVFFPCLCVAKTVIMLRHNSCFSVLIQIKNSAFLTTFTPCAVHRLEGERGCMSHGVAHARSETEQQPRSAARSSMRSPHTLCDSQSAVAGNVHAWYGVLLSPVRTMRPA